MLSKCCKCNPVAIIITNYSGPCIHGFTGNLLLTCCWTAAFFSCQLLSSCCILAVPIIYSLTQSWQHQTNSSKQQLSSRITALFQEYSSIVSAACQCSFVFDSSTLKVTVQLIQLAAEQGQNRQPPVLGSFQGVVRSSSQGLRSTNW